MQAKFPTAATAMKLQDVTCWAARAYFTAHIIYGDPLAHGLLYLPLEEARLRVVAPDGASLRTDRPEDFERSGRPETIFSTDTERVIDEFTAAYLRQAPGRYALHLTGLTQSSVSNVRAPYLLTYPPWWKRKLRDDTKRAYLMCTGDFIRTPYELMDLGAYNIYPLRILFQGVGSVSKLSSGTLLSTAQIKDLTAGVDHIIVPAYDDETQMVCSFDEGRSGRLEV